MSLIPGKYQHYKNENIDEYFRAVGVPYLVRKMISLSSPLLEIIQEGDTMTIKNTSTFSKLESTFKIGEEYVERMPNKNLMSTTTIISDREIKTISIAPENDVKLARHYTFTEDECIVTLIHENDNSIAKRYYRRVV